MGKAATSKGKEDPKGPSNIVAKHALSPPRSSKQGRGIETRLISHPIHAELSLQLVTYEDNLERRDAYNFPLKDGIKNPHTLTERAKNAAITYVNRRIPGTDENMMQLNSTSGEAYPRAVFIRKFPAPPTPLERKETMDIMEEIMRASETGKFPPPNIRKVDYTPRDRVRPLDDFLHDATIETLIKSLYDFEHLNEEFAESYGDLLDSIFGHPTSHRFARDLGRASNESE
ncbi:hypothetical protein MPSEU_000332500 [Mayamaea pseudoterrestris]|nr:hypothetical protein MPSEU_000332500 [Mayamaea pseudoterrestris]